MNKTSKRLKVVFDKLVDVEEKPFSENVTETCFRITISAAENLDGGSTIELLVEPEFDSGYEIIVDYKLFLGDRSCYVERDLWRFKEKLYSTTTDTTKIKIRLLLYVREVLAPQDLSASNSYRNLHILTSDRAYYVNATQLNQLGGRIFKNWFDRECQGETSIVVLSLDSAELETLMKACCSYSSPVIHRRNLDKILVIAEREKITGLLRLAETFLIESETINPIRKLEYAVEFRMSRLADHVLRPFTSKISRMDVLFDYLIENGESLDQVHMNVLELLEIHSDYVII